MTHIRVDVSELHALKGTTAQTVLKRCANEVKHWKLPVNLLPEQRAACERVLHDINLCFIGYAATVGAHIPEKAPNPMLEKMLESIAKF